MHTPSTWHHGLVAEYWATVNLTAPELDSSSYRKYLRSPVLDAGCGAGRVLARLRAEGFDVDGCDASPDMLDRCRERVSDATLWVSKLHELSPPRRYQTVLCCGVFGLGSTREQDIEAIQRLHDALLPGGTLVLDNEESPWEWQVRSRGNPSGDPISLSSRVDAVDEDDRCVHMTMRAEASDGRVEEHVLTMRQWYRDELEPLLHDTGFATIEVLPGLDEHTLVYAATRQSEPVEDQAGTDRQRGSQERITVHAPCGRHGSVQQPLQLARRWPRPHRRHRSRRNRHGPTCGIRADTGDAR